MINNPEHRVHYVARAADGSVLHYGVVEPGQYMSTGQPVVIQGSEQDQVNELALWSDEFDELPAEGFLAKDTFYRYNGAVIKVRQDHERTIYPPEDTPALFFFASDPNNPEPEWIENEDVVPGDIRVFEGVRYVVLMAHQTQASWTPPVATTLWGVASDPPTDEIQPWVQPAGAHDAYDIGDKVTHNGKTWESTAAANIWEPGVFGWEEIEE